VAKNELQNVNKKKAKLIFYLDDCDFLAEIGTDRNVVDEPSKCRFWPEASS
jgi:hypothetical protein